MKENDPGGIMIDHAVGKDPAEFLHEAVFCPYLESALPGIGVNKNSQIGKKPTIII
jgi:hypothetical protein